MPTFLDDLDLDDTSTNAAPSLTPKFFSSELTGKGGKVGLINQHFGPGNPTSSTHPNRPIQRKKRQSSGTNVTLSIPMHPFMAASMDLPIPLTVPLPELDQMFHAGTNNKSEVYVNVVPQGMVMYIDTTPKTGSKEQHQQYRIEVFTVKNPAQKDATVGGFFQISPNMVEIDWSYEVGTDVKDVIAKSQGSAFTFDQQAFFEYLENYEAYDEIVELAETWSGPRIGELMTAYIADVFRSGTSPKTNVLEKVAHQLSYLENYEVSLDEYREIHKALASHASPDVATELCKHNMNLLMSDTLNELDKKRSQLSAPPKPPQNVPSPKGRFSAQQLAAVTSDSPLVLCQAGAGTGKSTVILGRIDHLAHCGVDPKDITVLSFTNAAADNIKEKNPNVGSMTIARMIHDIYTLNYPDQDLSDVDTIVNSLDIFYAQDDVAALLRRFLISVDKKEKGAYTTLNSFIERNFDAVISILNRIGQTTLEMEIIICFQKIDMMREPNHVQSRYLIIDEVQDNSVFEFIYLLKYVAKHSENMFIVGDSSQTLYEFRSSNPKALNTLEGSGIFATYKLTTNYRSNQEILDFANVHLTDIEANRYAKIQLKSNMLGQPTEKSFLEKVTLDYRAYGRVSEFKDHFEGIFRHEIKEYVDTCLARGEQVAFLAHTRNDVFTMEAFTKKFWPNLSVANLVSDKTYATTVFSAYIKQFWNDAKQVPVKDAAFAITQQMVNNLDKLTKNLTPDLEKKISNNIAKWWLENSTAVRGWVNLYKQKLKTKDEFFDDLQQNLLDYEISQNAIKQSLTSQRNKERKEKNLSQNSPLIVSTIHGAKGLEFDNVVVIHKNGTKIEESAKRMFYVAFTRAMNTEYVLSYGTVKNAKIETDYELLVNALKKRDSRASLIAAGIDPDAEDDDRDDSDDD